MSENLEYQLRLTNEELIDFALEHLGEDESMRLLVQEHFLRGKDASSTVMAPSGDVQVLRSKQALAT